MPALHRRVAGPSNMTPAVFNLLIALVVIFFLATVCAITILVLRVKRARRSSAPGRSRRLTVDTDARLSEKHSLMDSPPASPPLTLPEIRITFPDEEAEKGRVVVVRMGDNAAVGLGPVDDASEQLPPYQPADGERFQSLDLERIGGLKEKLEKQSS